MPALKPVPGIAKVVINGTIDGVPAINIFHVGNGQDTSPWSLAEVAALSTGMRSAYLTHFIPVIGANYSLGNVDVIDLTSELGYTASASGSNVGGLPLGTGRLSAATSCCVTWKIARHYRGGHPRTYLPPPAVGSLVNGNTFTAAYVAAVQTAALGFMGAITSMNPGGKAGVAMQCLHRYQGRDADGRPIQRPFVLVDYISDAAVDTRVDTLRRRLGPDR